MFFFWCTQPLAMITAPRERWQEAAGRQVRQRAGRRSCPPELCKVPADLVPSAGLQLTQQQRRPRLQPSHCRPA